MMPPGAKGPKYSLEAVLALIASNDFSLARARALDPLRQHCGTQRAARAFAKSILSGLVEGAFSETIMQRFDQEFDVYGVLEDGVVWYVKLCIDIDEEGEEYVQVLSFHPAESPIKTKGGELKP
jgi:hypothetical protein